MNARCPLPTVHRTRWNEQLLFRCVLMAAARSTQKLRFYKLMIIICGLGRLKRKSDHHIRAKKKGKIGKENKWNEQMNEEWMEMTNYYAICGTCECFAWKNGWANCRAPIFDILYCCVCSLLLSVAVSISCIVDTDENTCSMFWVQSSSKPFACAYSMNTTQTMNKQTNEEEKKTATTIKNMSSSWHLPKLKIGKVSVHRLRCVHKRKRTRLPERPAWESLFNIQQKKTVNYRGFRSVFFCNSLHYVNTHFLCIFEFRNAYAMRLRYYSLKRSQPHCGCRMCFLAWECAKCKYLNVSIYLK